MRPLMGSRSRSRMSTRKTNVNILKTFTCTSRKSNEKETEKKIRMAIAKLFASHANARSNLTKTFLEFRSEQNWISNYQEVTIKRFVKFVYYPEINSPGDINLERFMYSIFHRVVILNYYCFPDLACFSTLSELVFKVDGYGKMECKTFPHNIY